MTQMRVLLCILTFLIRHIFLIRTSIGFCRFHCTGFINSHKVPTHIVDSVFTGDNEAIIEEEIKKANVICLVYAVSDFACFERVESYWLPLLMRLCTEYIPVILAGNKTDEGRDARLTDARVEQVVNAFDFVEVSYLIH